MFCIRGGLNPLGPAMSRSQPTACQGLRGASRRQGTGRNGDRYLPSEHRSQSHSAPNLPAAGRLLCRAGAERRARAGLRGPLPQHTVSLVDRTQNVLNNSASSHWPQLSCVSAQQSGATESLRGSRSNRRTQRPKPASKSEEGPCTKDRATLKITANT